MYTFIDLFAGIGGMRLGLEQALEHHGLKGECVFTSEWDPYACKTYRHNFPRDKHKIFGDITKLERATPEETAERILEEVPEHKILLAGFPCQPFSIAGVSKKKSLGRAHGFQDPTQGTLFFTLKEIIAARRPEAFILENVKNLASHDGGNTYREILRVLEKELGYQVHTMILDGKAFVPQHRERIYFIGFREPRRLKRIDLGKSGPRLDEDFFDTKDLDKYVLSKKLWKYLRAYAAKHKAKGNGFGYGQVTVGDITRTLSARYYKDGSEILVKRATGSPRRLTPAECQRLMGFPDTFELPQDLSDTRAYRQFGNSVVVPVVKAVACEMLRALQGSVDPDAQPIQVPQKREQLRLAKIA